MEQEDQIPNGKEFWINTNEGYRLSALANLKNDTRDIVVIVHGYLANKNYRLVSLLANDMPYNSVRFDCHGCGNSEGEALWSFGGYQREVHSDLRTVVNFLREHQWNIIGLIGHSRGANDVILYSNHYGDIPKIIALAPRYNMTEGVSNRFSARQLNELSTVGHFEIMGEGKIRRITKEGMEERLALDVLKMSECRKKHSLLLIHGTSDLIIPHGDSESYMTEYRKDPQRFDKLDLKLVPNCSHSFADNAESYLSMLNHIQLFLA